MEQTIISSEYVVAVKAIKQAILESRYRAARHVNKEVLALNYGIGRFISINSRSAKWGSNAIAVISSLLRQELPGVKGYSEASIKMMRTFYEEWRYLFENRQLPIDDLGNQPMVSGITDKIEIRQLVTDELSASDFKRRIHQPLCYSDKNKVQRGTFVLYTSMRNRVLESGNNQILSF